MTPGSEKARQALHHIDTIQSIDSVIEKIKNKTSPDTDPAKLPIEHKVTEEGTKERRAYIEKETGKKFPYLAGATSFEAVSQLQGNIENYIGMTMIPTGVVGPLKVIGTAAEGEYYIPLATTEGALVASYHRGAKACYLAGGITSICIYEGVQRSPLFKFASIAELGHFLSWILQHIDEYKKIAQQNSRFAKLVDVKVNIEGNNLIVTFEYHTGDAAGQNMVTICTEAICNYILENVPQKPVLWYIESNYSGDKKATASAFSSVRGKRVTAEIILPRAIVKDVLKATPEAIAEYCRLSTFGIVQSGAIGAHGHYANALAALFIATGQDAACVAEAAIGITRLETTDDGALYASVTLPNLITGTVGGGTGLPTQQECLAMMGCAGTGSSRRYAEICGALVLAGELSIAAALSMGHFAAAHKNLGRKQQG